MGLFGEFKGKYADIPDEQLNFYQRHIKRWQSKAPFPVSSGGGYGWDAKCGIDGRLTNSLGLADIDDLFEMKAPFLYGAIKNTYEVVSKALPENNKLQKVLGKYEQLQVQFQELKKRCISQKNIIESTMEQNRELIEQNKELIKQNQQLQSLLVSAKQASASATFSR